MHWKMKISSYLLIAITIMQLFTSCISNDSFTSNELRFTKPFESEKVIIFKSTTGLIDTIRFFRFKLDTIKHRNLEQGFYNENTLTVGYELTLNSFHKTTVQSIEKEHENFIFFLKAKNSHS